MKQTVRLVLKLQRFEIVVLGIAIFALSVIALLISSRLFGLPAEIARCDDTARCMFLQEEFAQLKLSAFPIVILNSILPIFAGLIIGVPIVAREIERGTAALPAKTRNLDLLGQTPQRPSMTSGGSGC